MPKAFESLNHRKDLIEVKNANHMLKTTCKRYTYLVQASCEILRTKHMWCIRTSINFKNEAQWMYAKSIWKCKTQK